MPAISLSSFHGFFVFYSISARQAPFHTISWSMALARFARAPLNLGLVLGERANRTKFPLKLKFRLSKDRLARPAGEVRSHLPNRTGKPTERKGRIKEKKPYIH